MGISFPAGEIFCCRGRKHLAVQRGTLSRRAECLTDLNASGKPGTGISFSAGNSFIAGKAGGMKGVMEKKQQWMCDTRDSRTDNGI